MKYDIDSFEKQLKKTLDKKRYNHTIGVAYTAASLAMRYEYNMEDALVAGLLHDNARFLDVSEMHDDAVRLGIEISEEENISPLLLHSKLGVHYANCNYGITDETILSAIRWHTTGRENMSLLEKIVYIADYIEPGRDKQPGLDIIRPLAFSDIDECMYKILDDTLNYLSGRARGIDLMSEKAYRYYKNIHLSK